MSTEEKFDLQKALERVKRETQPTWGGYPNWAWEHDSLAVIACDGHGNGAVLWTAGPHVRNEMEEGGLAHLSDLGFDDAPVGISVWQGKYVWYPGGYEYPQDGSTEASGKFRTPTDAEWIAIREGRCPWDEAEWCSPEPPAGVVE